LSIKDPTPIWNLKAVHEGIMQRKPANKPPQVKQSRSKTPKSIFTINT
jgi:hypothetical protein